MRMMYFYPHGNLCINNLCTLNNDNKPEYNTEMLMYDQEPLDIHKIHSYLAYLQTYEYPNRYLILANSEIGKNKTKILQRHHKIIDFYYFFHGFAALDWYRANQFFCVQKNYKKDFLLNCNGIGKTRTYRILFTALLQKNNLLNNGFVSFSTTEHKKNYIEHIKDCRYMHNNEVKLVEENLVLQDDIRYDKNALGSSSAIINDDIYSQVRFQIVAETSFFENRNHLTEKVFQPIVTKTPFLILSNANTLALLEHYGFKTYQKWLYVDDTNASWRKRMESAVKTVEKFCRLSRADKDRICMEMQEVAEYNYNHFYKIFPDIILQETINNYRLALEKAGH